MCQAVGNKVSKGKSITPSVLWVADMLSTHPTLDHRGEKVWSDISPLPLSIKTNEHVYQTEKTEWPLSYV